MDCLDKSSQARILRGKYVIDGVVGEGINMDGSEQDPLAYISPPCADEGSGSAQRDSIALGDELFDDLGGDASSKRRSGCHLEEGDGRFGWKNEHEPRCGCRLSGLLTKPEAEQFT